MVHALKETHRVLKPNGLLIDLRPASAHRHIGLGEARHWKQVGTLHEVLDDDFAADAAVEQMVREGYLHPERRLSFQLDRVMDTIEEVREWLKDFDQRRDLPTHEPLLHLIEKQRAQPGQPVKISVRGPMKLGVLRKLRPAAKTGQWERS